MTFVSIYQFNCVSLSIDIEDLPHSVQKQLYDELLDRDVQTGELGHKNYSSCIMNSKTTYVLGLTDFFSRFDLNIIFFFRT